MEDEFRKDFEELLRLMDAGRLQDFKKKAYECLPVDIALWTHFDPSPHNL